MAKEGFNSREIRNNIRQLKKEMPRVTATMAVSWFKDSFRNQGFIDRRLRYWKKRKRVDRKRKGRAILVDTGRLRRSIRRDRVTFRQVVISSKLPYSAVHNEGLGNIPQRKFMGESDRLERKMRKFIFKSIDKALGF